MVWHGCEQFFWILKTRVSQIYSFAVIYELGNEPPERIEFSAEFMIWTWSLNEKYRETEQPNRITR